LRACASRGEWRVTGTAFRRTGPGLERLDLSQTDAIPGFLDRLAPDIIIHHRRRTPPRRERARPPPARSA
jgi:hypothetical protein